MSRQAIFPNVHFTYFIYDAGAGVKFKVLHGVFIDCSYINDSVRLAPFEDKNWNARYYALCFREMIPTFSGDSSPRRLEKSNVICDNFP
jgi:hypothetical protein